MAHSRLEKIGTIFSRVTGLLKSGALKVDEKPLWYEVYAAFPPKLEPRFDRPAPNIQIQNIFYNEDVIRANYHKSLKFQDSINLSNIKNTTNCQEFIKIFHNLKDQGPLDEEKIFETAKEMMEEQLKARYLPKSDEQSEPIIHYDLVKKFSEAKSKQPTDLLEDKSNQSKDPLDAKSKQPTDPSEVKSKQPTDPLNIKDLFKD